MHVPKPKYSASGLLVGLSLLQERRYSLRSVFRAQGTCPGIGTSVHLPDGTCTQVEERIPNCRGAFPAEGACPSSRGNASRLRVTAAKNETAERRAKCWQLNDFGCLRFSPRAGIVFSASTSARGASGTVLALCVESFFFYLPERVWIGLVGMGFFRVWEVGGFLVCLRGCGCGCKYGFLWS